MQGTVTIFHRRLPATVRRESFKAREKIASKIVAEAKLSAPVVSGAYVRGMSVTTDGGMFVRVVDNDETSIHKEYGTSDTPAHAALTNAAMGYGRYSGTRPRGGK